jgi:uncharacterized protein YjiS (DUF1127 family)
MVAAALMREPVAPGLVAGLIAWCRACVERRRQRRLLATLSDRALRDIALDEHALRDIGIARARAWLDCEKTRRWP